MKIYRLKNADPSQMATILQALFRPQITATQNAGRPAGGGPQDAVARRKFIIATTNITSGRRLINSLLPFDV